MTSVNKPEVSRTIVLSYITLLIFIASLTVFFSYAAICTPMGMIAGTIAAVVSAFAGLIILLILVSIYQTRYILTKEELIIKTTKLIGGSKTIPLRTIESAEITMIPFGIRLFGASFHGGYYQIPSLGRVFMAITNFKDGLLIRTTDRNYIITPSNPTDFITTIEKQS